MNTLLEGENKSFFYRRILTVTIPVVIQNMLNIGLNLADTIMIGRLGELELAATGVIELRRTFHHYLSERCFA